MDEKISRFNKGEPSKLIKYVSDNFIKYYWNNTWERLFFPINVYDDHWMLIVLDKTVKQVMVFDSLIVSNQYYANKVLNLVQKWKVALQNGESILMS